MVRWQGTLFAALKWFDFIQKLWEAESLQDFKPRDKISHELLKDDFSSEAEL